MSHFDIQPEKYPLWFRLLACISLLTVIYLAIVVLDRVTHWWVTR